MYENETLRERVLLVGVNSGDEAAARSSLVELAGLAETAGAEVAGSLLQNREQPSPATYIGKGKISELREMLELLEANGILCDDELSPAQLRNLEQELDCKVMDRTLLILDIFAGRARTSEGKIQVELAQLTYRRSRLAGLGKSLSRLGGGIGTRGPGETKLETDRRQIGSRIHALKAELAEVKRHRDLLREGRGREGAVTAAIVGYTNAGKSTLLNVLTKADVLEEDALFATLDPTTRLLELPDGGRLLLTDTVGFIRKLPHHLVEAFQSTLEEAVFADIIIHVADASNPEVDRQMAAVYETLHQLNADGKPVITLFNKIDRCEERPLLRDAHADHVLAISARTGEGLDSFLDLLGQVLRERQAYVDCVIPYAEAGLLAQIRKTGQLLSEEYREEGIAVTAYVPAEIYNRIK